MQDDRFLMGNRFHFKVIVMLKTNVTVEMATLTTRNKIHTLVKYNDIALRTLQIVF